MRWPAAERDGYPQHGRTFPPIQAVKYPKLIYLKKKKMPICIPWINQESADFVYAKMQRFPSHPSLCKCKVLFRKTGHVFWGIPYVPGIYIALQSPFCQCLVPVLDISVIKIAWNCASASSFYIMSSVCEESCLGHAGPYLFTELQRTVAFPLS